jgi:hypothetical protein
MLHTHSIITTTLQTPQFSDSVDKQHFTRETVFHMVNLTSVYKTNILVTLQHVYVNAVISTKLPTVQFFCRGCRLTWRCPYYASASQQLSYGFQTTRWNADSDPKARLVQSFCVHRLLRHTLLLAASVKSNAHLANIDHVQELYPLNTSVWYACNYECALWFLFYGF